MPGAEVVGRSGSVGFETSRSEVIAGGDAHVGVEGGGEAAEQGDGGFGAAGPAATRPLS
jgi:hypothetical protein